MGQLKHCYWLAMRGQS